MGVLLQGFYKLRPNRAVPSPADGDPNTPWWWDHLAAQANDFRTAGFTAIWLPPVLKTSAGAHSGADGYGPFDDCDIGSKSQMGTVPTRFGSREQLQRCIATYAPMGSTCTLIWSSTSARATPVTSSFATEVPTARRLSANSLRIRSILCRTCRLSLTVESIDQTRDALR